MKELKKYILIIIIIIFILLMLWIGKAGASLSSCFLENSERYKDYPEAYARQEISHDEFKRTFFELKKENLNCQRQVVNRYYMPTFLINLLTSIATKGRGLP